MSADMLDHIMSVLPEVLEQNPKIFPNEERKNDWYGKRKNFLENNDLFLEKVLQVVKDRFNEEYSTEELFYMQKLYLFYPDKLPKKLLSLSWKHIRLLLGLCSYNKRTFYIDLCYDKDWNYDTLEYYLLNDLYEKYLILLQEISDYDETEHKEFINHLLEVQNLIFEEL